MTERFGSSLWIPLCDSCKNHPDPRDHAPWGKAAHCHSCGEKTKWKLQVAAPMRGVRSRSMFQEEEAR